MIFVIFWINDFLNSIPLVFISLFMFSTAKNALKYYLKNFYRTIIFVINYNYIHIIYIRYDEFSFRPTFFTRRA